MWGRRRAASSPATTFLWLNDGMVRDLRTCVVRGLRRRVVMKDVIHGHQ